MKMEKWAEGRKDGRKDGRREGKSVDKCLSHSQWCIFQLSYRIRAAILSLGVTALSQGSHIRYLAYQIFILGFIAVAKRQ